MDDVNDISLLTLGQETPSEALTSSLTRLIAKLQDNSLSEDDVINTLVELAELEVTVPAIWAGIVVRRLEKMKEGRWLSWQETCSSSGRELPLNTRHLSTI